MPRRPLSKHRLPGLGAVVPRSAGAGAKSQERLHVVVATDV